MLLSQHWLAADPQWMHFNYTLWSIKHLYLFDLPGNPQVKYYCHFTDEETEMQEVWLYKVPEPGSSRARAQTQVSYKFLVLAPRQVVANWTAVISESSECWDPQGPPQTLLNVDGPVEGTRSLYFNECLMWSWWADGTWPSAVSLLPSDWLSTCCTLSPVLTTARKAQVAFSSQSTNKATEEVRLAKVKKNVPPKTVFGLKRFRAGVIKHGRDRQARPGYGEGKILLIPTQGEGLQSTERVSSMRCPQQKW